MLSKIIVLGNYRPSNHGATRIVSGGGIAPTVMENHGQVTAIVEYKNIGTHGREVARKTMYL